MITKEVFIKKYIQLAISDAEKEVEHARKVGEALQNLLPDNTNADIYGAKNLLISKFESNLIGKLRKPETTAKMIVQYMLQCQKGRLKTDES